jgi:hypothetical protein
MSKYFAFWKMCYSNNWVTLGQVKQAEAKGLITADEYKTITGLDYVAQ